MSKHNEMEKLQAELEAARAEIETLKAKSATGKKSLKTTGVAEADMAPADTNLGKAHRLDRAAQIDAFPKLARMLPVGRVCELIVQIAEEAAGHTKTSHDEVFAAVTTRTTKAKKETAEPVVQDNTAELVEA